MKLALRTLLVTAFPFLLLGCSDHVAGNPNPDAPKDAGASQDLGGGADAPSELSGETAADKPADSGKDGAGDKPDLPSDVAGLPCKSNTECGYEAYCDISCTSPSDSGVCVVLPAECSKISAPVCGCDKVTYRNDCFRQLGKVAKYFDGECEGGGTGGTGGGGGLDGAGGGAPTDSGVACPSGMAYCPCTGTCYDTKCLSCCMFCGEDAGTSPPDASGVVCGGKMGLPCAMGEFCEFPAGMCSSADILGECRMIPAACTLVYDPVCGCDGKTHGNDCARQAASVSKDYDGECK